ncbi:MAG: energy transducer TonB [Gemmatimonadetes bacterium]|nr:energy transducer TonB [Gemmatimonadota bacterium]
MATAKVAAMPAVSVLETANDRFKGKFRQWFWGSVTVATAAHFLLFVFFPKLTAGDVGFDPRELTAVNLPPEIEIPPPPKQIQRPAIPVVARTEIEEDVTIAPTTFEENPVENLPPPPEGANLGDQPAFTPFEVRPEIKDLARARQIMERYYPQMLKQAGIGGTVIVWAFLDDKGRLRNHKLQKTSGFPALDEAAIKALYEISEKVGFTPALNRDRPVPVWISQSVTFAVR